MLLVLLVACSDPCALRWGTDKLACQFDQAIAAPDSAPLFERITPIPDQTTRDAAILRWIADHRTTLRPEEVAQICTRLPPGEQGQCQRRAQAAHLSR